MKIAEWFDNLPLPGPVKDIIFVVVVVGGISLLSQLLLGLWTPMVAVESGSMVPNLNIGDIVVVQGASRTDVIPWEEAEKTGTRNDSYVCDNMPHRICREINTRIFQSKYEKADDCYKKYRCIGNEKIVTGPVTVEINNHLNESEECHNHGEEDHRGHDKEPDQVCQTCQGPHEDRFLITGKLLEIN